MARPEDSELIREKLTWHERISTVFGIDVRSMAVFRMVLGMMLITDLILRLPTLRLMTTDDGIVTREVGKKYWNIAFGGYFDWPWVSIHHLSGTLEFQLALFVVAGIFAISLSFGFFTRISTIVSWFLLASLHARSPLILSSGDMIMKMMLFWSMFLPLGQVWSLDALFRRRDLSNTRHWLCNVATAGFLIQFFCMYLFTGLSKCNAIWFEGYAMEYVMRLDIYVKPLGKQLLEYPELLKFVTISTVWVEVISPLLLLIPFRNHWFRILNIVIYWVLHISIAMTMSIGLFSFISMMGWLMFIPTIVWTRNWIPSMRTQSAVEPPRWRKRIRPVFSALGVAMIALVISLNINNAYIVQNKRFIHPKVEGLAQLLMLDQHFRMFDVPPQESPWFVYDARLEDGSKVDLLTGKLPDMRKPESVRVHMKYHHLRKLHRNLVAVPSANPTINEVQQVFRTALADYYVKHWNETHSDHFRVKSLKLTCFKQLIGPDYNGIDQRHTIWFEIKPSGSVFDREFENLKNGEFF